MGLAGIRILVGDNNKRGALFSRLTGDLLFALGYDGLRFNVHKSGREIDIQGVHRYEQRKVIAECKATEEKTGGDELNKFLGILTRERRKSSSADIVGYFVSLNGFRASALEQELETQPAPIILVDGERVVCELQSCRVVVQCQVAIERAGRYAQHAGLSDLVCDGIELLGHERGYLWAVYYSRGHLRTHFTLIHADGSPLPEEVAQDVAELDLQSGGSLNRLTLLAPPTEHGDATITAAALASYNHWIGEEYGFIHLDGLPADNDISATRLKLERLFVPLHAFTSSALEVSLGDCPRFSIGQLLQSHSHLAILGPPGAGKSTLLKRIATAYAFKARRMMLLDELPDVNWLPVVLRCRELRDRAHRPILEIIDEIPSHSGMSDLHRQAFRSLVQESMRSGEALLLVDGLDEISDEGSRQVFASRLRTFIAMFPNVHLVITSREAGFRMVARTIASVCTRTRLAPLEQTDVIRLCEQWHVEVVGNSDKVRSDARALAGTIWSESRICALAKNPLLLTTLFIVRRWMGEIPRKRVALYREAIKVLVRTWNIEGYSPLDEDETLAQLSYIACAMFQEGKQQITASALLALLQRARKDLEVELQFASISPSQFIERIEYRSSLLIQVGHERTELGIEPLYEFRHLTFQEYLAARGCVEEQYPGRNDGRSLTDVLSPHFRDESWLEVISLAAVLAGRRAEELIKRLVNVSRPRRGGGRHPLSEVRKRLRPVRVLHRCICDEVHVTHQTLRRALMRLLYNVRPFQVSEWIEPIFRGKYGPLLKTVAEELYLASPEDMGRYLRALIPMARVSMEERQPSDRVADRVERLLKALESEDRLARIWAAVECSALVENPIEPTNVAPFCAISTDMFRRLATVLTSLIRSDDLHVAIAACRAVRVMGRSRIAGPPDPSVFLSLLALWQKTEGKRCDFYAILALLHQDLLARDAFMGEPWGDCDAFLERAMQPTERPHCRQAAIVVAWYRRRPWSDAELAGHLLGTRSPHGQPFVPAIDSLATFFRDAGHIAS
jgi:NACHT domain/Restriction endonuclease